MERCRVLVVDDDPNVLRVMKRGLVYAGYGVEEADSGESALALVDSFGPDVILTDVRMPKMGGAARRGKHRMPKHPLDTEPGLPTWAFPPGLRTLLAVGKVAEGPTAGSVRGEPRWRSRPPRCVPQ